MSPIAAIAAEPVRLSPQLETLDAHQLAAQAAGNPALDPGAIGQSLVSGLDGFNAHEAGFRANVAQALDGTPAPDAASGTDMADAASPPAGGLSEGQMMDQGQALQRHSLGVMMQTYSFALEATLVTNAATTFTSSVNTLIKTQ